MVVVGGGGAVVFADGIIARQKGEANREMNSGSRDYRREFSNFFSFLFFLENK